jgi:hypothetical protein
LDAKAIDATLAGGWDSSAQFRSQITPIFTRAYGIQPELSFRDDLPDIRYTFDYREILHQFEKRWEPFGGTVKDVVQKTHEILLKYTKDFGPYGIVTLNPGYKRVLLTSGEDPNVDEHRDEYFLNYSHRLTENLEMFGQVDYYEGKHVRSPFILKPEQWLGRVEARYNIPEHKFNMIYGYSHSLIEFKPEHNNFRKQELYADFGKDITDKLSGSVRQELILTKNKEPDSFIPFSTEANVWNSEGKISYTLFPNFDTRLGLEHSKGLGFDDFDNASILWENEYYRYGIVRLTAGLRYTNYYNLHEDLATLFFRLHIAQ